MTPDQRHHEANNGPDDRSTGRAFNTPENATKAVATGRACISALVPGRVWNHRAPRGEFELKGSLMLDNKPVAILHFNPEDGSVLPRGLHALSAGNDDALLRVADRLKTIPQELTALDGAEFREPEFCWAIPLAHQGRIVGHIKVSADGEKVVADKKAVDELIKLGEH